MLGIAQYSGNVLRRPNVSIYLSVMLAYIYYLCKMETKCKREGCKWTVRAQLGKKCGFTKVVFKFI